MVSATAVLIVLALIVIGIFFFKPKMFSGSAPSVLSGDKKGGVDSKLSSQIRDLAGEINQWMIL